MWQGIRIAALVVLFSTLAADFGTHTTEYFGRLDVPSPGRGDTQSQHETDTAKERQHGQSTQGHADTTPPLGDEQPTNQHGAGSKPEHTGEWYTSPDWWIAGFTGGLFVVTGLLWLFTAMLWWTTRRAVADGEKAIKAANATAAQATRTANAMARQARAIVGAEIAKIFLDGINLIKVPRSPTITMVDYIQAGQPPKFSQPLLTFRNVGRTRGTITAISIAWKVIKSIQPELPPGLKPSAYDVIRDHFVIMTEAPANIPCDHVRIELSDYDLTLIKAGRAWLWVYGYFVYTNIMETPYDIGFAAFWESQSRLDMREPKSAPLPRGFVFGGPEGYWFERGFERED